MSLTTEDRTRKTREACDVTYNRGLAQLAVQDLIEENLPKNHISKVEAQRKMMEIKLNPGETPNKIFERISKIENESNDNTRSLEK